MSWIFLTAVMILIAIAAAGDEHCRATNCKEDGPIIRFPFWLKEQQAEECGYSSAFQLSCTKSNETMLTLRYYYANTSDQGRMVLFHIEAFVDAINYESQKVHVRIAEGSLF